jgi:hypothetical protein
MEQRLSMPRQPRLDTPSALHHLMARGIDGLKIFGGKKDCEDFLGRLKDFCDKAARVYTPGLNEQSRIFNFYSEPLRSPYQSACEGF